MKLKSAFFLFFLSTHSHAGIGGFGFMPHLSPPSVVGINVARAANGGVANASSEHNSNLYEAAGVIDGNRTGANWRNHGGWNDDTSNVFPDWIVVTFSSSQTIKEVNVITAQDTETSTAQPTLSMSCGNKGIKDFEVQYWDSNTTAWITIPSGNVTNNDKVWRQFRSTFTTNKIRVYITATGTGGANDFYSRLVELEAWTEETP